MREGATPVPGRRRGIVLAVLAALIGLALAHAAVWRGTGPSDDDYICYRYAASLVAGEGLSFNPGERVEGFTVPLWVGLLAGGMAIGIGPALLSLAVSALAAAAVTALLALSWWRRHPDSLVPLPAVLAALSPALAYHANLGLGTTLLGALLYGWFFLAERAHERARTPWAAATVLGTAGLLRQEALLFAIPFALASLGPRNRKRSLAPLLALLLPALWTLFRLGYYGRLLPVTYLVKKLPFLEDLGYGTAYLASSTLETGALVWLVLALAPLVLGPLTREEDRASPAVRAGLAGLLLHTLYVAYVGGDYLPLSRFLVPALPLLLDLGCRGGRALLAGATARRVAGTAAVVLLLWPTTLRGEIRARYEFEVERWAAVGRALGHAAEPGTLVATSPIGAIGYLSGLPIVDILGVTNEAVLRARPDLSITLKGHHRHDAAWVLGREPDLLIPGNAVLVPGPDGGRTLLVNAWERGLLEHPDFARLYHPIQLEVEGSYPLILYLRQGSTPPRGWEPATAR